jgi:hypothetical protein
MTRLRDIVVKKASSKDGQEILEIQNGMNYSRVKRARKICIYTRRTVTDYSRFKKYQKN